MDHAELIASRLCHDLVSPLGAIGNGLELLRMTFPASEEMALLDQAVNAAQARLLLYRLAFGHADAGQTVSPHDMGQALHALETNRPIVVSTQTGALPRPQARRLALAALCAESALAWGGRVTLDGQTLFAEGKRLRLDPALWQALADGRQIDQTSASDVHFALLAQTPVQQVQTTDTALSITP